MQLQRRKQEYATASQGEPRSLENARTGFIGLVEQSLKLDDQRSETHSFYRTTLYFTGMGNVLM